MILKMSPLKRTSLNKQKYTSGKRWQNHWCPQALHFLDAFEVLYSQAAILLSFHHASYVS